jgi:HEAT repeat protein
VSPSLAPVAFPTFDFAPLIAPTLELDVPTPSFEFQGVTVVPPRAMSFPDELAFESFAAGGRSALERYRPEQGSPEDSLYRAGREALNRGEYARASAIFQSLETKYPRARVVPAALYYRAFALYRSGATEELRAGLTALRAQQEKYPEAAADQDVLTLRTRLQAALAARGDAQAAAELRAAAAAGGGAQCDREDVEVRAEALSALAQLNPPDARPTLKKVLARRDECSVGLRRRAVYILGRSGTDEAAADLIEVAKNDPDPGVRTDAISMLGRSAGAGSVKTLETIFNESTDDRTRQAALSALRSKGGPEARRVLRSIVERGDLNERMRAEAIMQLAAGDPESQMVSEMRAQASWSTGTPRPASAPRSGATEEDAAYLRGLYAKTDSRIVKAAIISGVSRIGGTANDQWVLAIARNKDEDMTMRREALSRLRSTTLSVDDLSKLFESLSERELRSAVLSQLGNREEPAATDKLLEIVRSGTDPQIRRQAINILSRKNDPRTTKLLLELVEKP